MTTRHSFAGRFLVTSLCGVVAILLVDTWSTWRAEQVYQAEIAEHQDEYQAFVLAMKTDMVAFKLCNSAIRRGNEVASLACITNLAETAQTFGVLHLTGMLVDKYEHQFNQPGALQVLSTRIQDRALADFHQHAHFIKAHDNRVMAYQSSMLPWLSNPNTTPSAWSQAVNPL